MLDLQGAQRVTRSKLRAPLEEPPQYRGSAGPRQVSRTRVPRRRRIRPDGGRPRRTMPDPRLMLLVCQTLMPDLGGLELPQWGGLAA